MCLLPDASAVCPNEKLDVTFAQSCLRGDREGIFSVFHNFSIFLTPGGQGELTYMRFLEPSFERDRKLDTTDDLHDKSRVPVRGRILEAT